MCDTVGTVCRSIGGVDEDGGRFMRVKVNLDISLPLCRGGQSHGSTLSMNGSPIVVTGVENSIMETRIVPCGFVAKVHLRQRNISLGNGYVPHPIDHSISPSFLSLAITIMLLQLLQPWRI